MMTGIMRSRWPWWAGGAVVVFVAAVLGVIRPGGGDHAPVAAPAVSPQVVSSPSPSLPSPSLSDVPSSLPAPAPSDCVAAAVDGLSLTERVGQVLMVGIGVDAPSGLGD